MDEGQECKRGEGSDEDCVSAIGPAISTSAPSLNAGGGSALPYLELWPRSHLVLGRTVAFRILARWGPVPAQTRHEGATGEEAGMVCPSDNSVVQPGVAKAAPGGGGVCAAAADDDAV